MTFYSIAIQSLKRRKTKTFFLIFGLVLAVSSVITLTIISNKMSESVSKDLDEYGANIIITPKSNALSLNYGGLSVGKFSYNQKSLYQSDIAKIMQINNNKNISVISPKLLVIENIDSLKTLVAGVMFDKEIQLKKWWKINGKLPEKTNEALIGYEAAQKLKLKVNDNIVLKGSTFNKIGRASCRERV